MVRNADGSIQRATLRRLPTVRRTLSSVFRFDRGRGDGLYSSAPPADGPAPRVEAVSGALLAVRGDCYRSLGGFDEGFFLHCEDLDLFSRARNAGWEIVLAHNAEATHRKGVSHRSQPLHAQFHKHRSFVRYFGKQMTRWALIPWAALIWAHFLVFVPVYWLSGRRVI